MAPARRRGRPPRVVLAVCAHLWRHASAASGAAAAPSPSSSPSPPLPECTFEACPRCLPTSVVSAANLTIALDDGSVRSTALRIGRATAFWDSQSLYAQLVGILAAEKLGINVLYVAANDEMASWMGVNNCIGWSDWLCDILSVAGEGALSRKLFQDVLADVMFAPELSHASLGPENFEGTQLDYEQKEGVQIGPSGYTAVPALYVYGDTVEQAAIDGLDLRWLPQLKADSTRAYFDSPRTLTEGGVNSSAPGCTSDVGFVQSGIQLLVDLGWTCAGSWWLTPACAALGGWDSACIAMVDDDWGNQKPELYNALAVSKVPIAKIIVGYDAWFELLSARSFNVTFNWWTPDASLARHRPQRVSIPADVEPRPDVLLKGGWLPALQASDKLRQLLENSFVRTAEMEELMQSIAAAYRAGLKPGDGTFQKVACDWLRANEPVWKVWLPSARSCLSGEIFDEQSQQCAPCPRGSYGRPRGVACLPCHPGTFASAEGLSECSACDPGRFSAASGSSAVEACLRCPIGYFSDGPGRAACDACNATFVTPFPGATASSDCTCPGSTYLRRWPGNGPMGADAWCDQCTLGLKCSGGLGPPTQAAGYAAGPLDPATEAPTSIVACDDLVCPDSAPLGTCADHREGMACDLCTVGFTSSGGRCVPCSGNGPGLPIAIVAVGTALSATVLILYAMRKPGPNSASVLTLTLTAGITINVLQTLSSFKKLAGDWPEPMASLYSMLRIFSFDIKILKPTCMMPTNLPEMTYLGSLLLHPMYAVLLVLGAQLMRLCGRQVPGDELLNVQGLVMLSLFIALAIVALLPWQCQGNPDGTSSVATARAVRCWASSGHKVMLVLSLIALSIYVVGGVAVVAWATWRYPSQVSSARGVSFIRRFQFLFARFAPQRYWFGLIFVIRSLLVALLPVALVNQPQAALMLLVFVLTTACAIQCRLWPWRMHAVNRLDAATSVLVLLILNGGAFLSEKDASNMRRFLQYFFSVILGGLLVVALLTVFVSGLKLMRHSKKYGVFLCHHKQGAAVLARWFKLVLCEHTSERVFLDSDELDRLDKVFSVVAHDTKHLVALLTHETLQRIWCAGEIASAVRHGVGVVPVTCNDFQWPSDDMIDGIANTWTHAQKTEVLSLGVGITDIQAAYRALRGRPSVDLDRRLSQAQQESVVAHVFSRCTRLRGAGSRPPCCGLVADAVAMRRQSTRTRNVAFCDAEVAIAGNMADAESACVCAVLQRLLMRALQAPVAVLSGRGDEIRPDTRIFVAALTRGVLQNPTFAAFAVEAHRRPMVSVVPVIADQYFVFPDPQFWEEMEQGAAGPDMSSPELMDVDTSEVAAMYRWLFNVLAMRFSAAGSGQILDSEIQELLMRFGGARKILSGESISHAVHTIGDGVKHMVSTVSRRTTTHSESTQGSGGGSAGEEEEEGPEVGGFN